MGEVEVWIKSSHLDLRHAVRLRPVCRNSCSGLDVGNPPGNLARAGARHWLLLLVPAAAEACSCRQARWLRSHIKAVWSASPQCALIAAVSFEFGGKAQRCARSQEKK